MNMTFEEFYKERFLDYYLEFAYAMEEAFIKGYSEEFQKQSKRLGYDDETIRRTLFGNLFEMGFRCEHVAFVIHVDYDEWDEATNGRVLNGEFIRNLYERAKVCTEDFFVKFRKNHPDFFEPSAEE